MQRIHHPAHLLLCAMLFTAVVTSADESERRVDELKLKQFQRSVKIVEVHYTELDAAMDTQFDKLVTDALNGGIQDDQAYVEPVADLAERILEEFDDQLNDSMVARLRNTLARQDSEFAGHVNAVIVERNRLAADLIGENEEPDFAECVRLSEEYGISHYIAGETAISVGRALYLIKHSLVDAILHVNPIFCCPGVVTASIFRKMQEDFQIPIIDVFYDGTGNPNKIMIPHLHYLKQLAAGRQPTLAHLQK